jgi:hypothetical protein
METRAGRGNEAERWPLTYRDDVTEQQAYQVERVYPGFELRRYEAHVLAEVQVAGSFESAGNQAFRSLVGYIGGRNQGGRRMAMTAPVLQRPFHDEHAVAFVMPAGESIASLPSPSDPRVALRPVAEQRAAVVRYTGRWSEGGYRQRLARLRADVAAAGLVPDGEPRWARFDPPWTPWWLRRNEIVLPVR